MNGYEIGERVIHNGCSVTICTPVNGKVVDDQVWVENPMSGFKYAISRKLLTCA